MKRIADSLLDELATIADRLRVITPPAELPLAGAPVGFDSDPAGIFYRVRLKLGLRTYTVGVTANADLAAQFSDCVQFHFSTWIAPTKNPLRHYNVGPDYAQKIIGERWPVKTLLDALETFLVRSGCIESREVKEAGRAARTSAGIAALHAESLVKLNLRVTMLERAVARLAKKTWIAPPAIVNFSPPGSTSVNSDVTKRIFKIP